MFKISKENTIVWAIFSIIMLPLSIACLKDSFDSADWITFIIILIYILIQCILIMELKNLKDYE